MRYMSPLNCLLGWGIRLVDPGKPFEDDASSVGDRFNAHEIEWGGSYREAKGMKRPKSYVIWRISGGPNLRIMSFPLSIRN